MTRYRAWRPLLLWVVITLLAFAPPVAMARKGVGTTSASGWVFAPNPVASSGNQGLTDNKDADSEALNDELSSVTLTNLDGSGYLRGAYADVVSGTGPPAFETDGTYEYTRHDDRFEQVMAYYWVTQAQLYIQSLGFTDINNQPQRVRLDQLGYDNSFATDHPKDEMRFGKGGVDDAEDAEVILHEYGHRIHFSQGFPYGSWETDAIGEGFGDYWAATVSTLFAPGVTPAVCIADWDAVSYTDAPHCLRVLDANLRYPDDLTDPKDPDGGIHHDGQIWSQALWDIRVALGNVRADRIILSGQAGFTGTTMPELAAATVGAALGLYGVTERNAVRAAFQARGIL